MKINKKRKNFGFSKKPVNKAVLAALLSLLICACFTFMLGSYLADKAELTSLNTTSPPAVTQPAAAVDSIDKTPAPEIQAYLTLPQSEDALNGTVNILVETATTAVTLPLFSNGQPLFASSVTGLFGLTPFREQSAGELCLPYKEKGIYVSAVFNSRALEFEKSQKDASDAFELVVLEEIAASGADETLLFFGPVSVSEGDKILSYYTKIKDAGIDMKTGIAIPYETIAAERGAALIYDLWSAFDFICFDFTGAYLAENESLSANDDGTPSTGKVTTGSEETVCAAVRDALYYITKYNARIILPETNNKEAFFSLFNEEALTNYQFK